MSYEWRTQWWEQRARMSKEHGEAVFAVWRGLCPTRLAEPAVWAAAAISVSLRTTQMCLPRVEFIEGNWVAPRASPIGC